ncbi:Pyrophosphate--fructose 6-phosphate 1-phosphotransferase [Paraconexibacter sp. AEG42_29]|uniref:ATP-dependent 6-phosphofructokinase n=1 Tax=Paraconexibacter sp. AEG42_29 TaxID=2997339 RepID=A0AAU7ASR2_9ACTN
MRIGILTGGGDCPGLNAVIRAVVRSAYLHGDAVVGFRDGWGGVLDGSCVELPIDRVAGILPRGGTILGTSRRSALEHRDVVAQRFREQRLDGLIAVGGNGTLFAAHELSADLPIVGVPKTIDNDISGTDRTFGFDTAVHIATEAIDRLHTTAESHYRNQIVEVMGRNAGWIALHAGLAGGADVILVPERPFDLEEVAERVLARRRRGRSFSIIVVAEGAAPLGGELVTKGRDDPLGRPLLGGIGHWLERELEERTGAETRAVVLGHVQRGGTPTAYDRVLASRLGQRAHLAVKEGRFGTMAALRSSRIELVPLIEATVPKLVSDEELELAEAFLG